MRARWDFEGVDQAAGESQDWRMEPPPILLAWAGIVLSIIAIGIGLMTLPTAFQMWWGKADLEIEFIDDSNDSSRSLRCQIKNKPLTCKLLQVLGVTRDVALGLQVKASVTEEKTGTCVWSKNLELRRIYRDPSMLIDLHVGTPADSMMVLQKRSDSTALLPFKMPSGKTDSTVIKPGLLHTSNHCCLR